MVSTLSYSGTAFSLGNQRAYDSWGNIRNSDSSGDPKGRYCAALGHKSDDESGLTYMRARYYDAVAGRFMSEDSAMNGRNWYTYCSNEPICQADKSGAAEGNAMEQEFYAIIEGMKQWLENNGMSGFWANKISCGATFMLCMKAALEAFSLAVGFFQTAGAAADDAAFLFNVGLWNQGATAMAASAGAGLMGMVYMAVGLISLQGAYDALELSIDGGGDD
jgi:RHS repeat-associated protein